MDRLSSLERSRPTAEKALIAKENGGLVLSEDEARRNIEEWDIPSPYWDPKLIKEEMCGLLDEAEKFGANVSKLKATLVNELNTIVSEIYSPPQDLPWILPLRMRVAIPGTSQWRRRSAKLWS